MIINAGDYFDPADVSVFKVEKTEKPAREVVAACLDAGVLCLTAKDKVRLLPALNIPTDVLCEALDVIIKACE